jgi:hypothetical protein
MKNKLLSKGASGRRRFLLGLTSLAAGSLFFGYKAISKDATNTSVENRHSDSSHRLTPPPNARLGINLSGIAYWATEFPFVDLMHQSGQWISQPPSGDWGTGPELVLDEHGWVKELAKGCRATKIICSGVDAAYSSGTYIVLYDGEGEVQLTAPIGVIKKKEQGRLEVDVDATKGMFAIDIVATNPQNYLRNLRVVIPGFESSYENNPWHPQFLKRWSGVACVRLMDMMVTNNSAQTSWQSRPNDAYIKQFAMVVKRDLNTHLHAWVEYSNEVWNGGFGQYKYAAKQGQALKLANNEWEAAFHYNVHRSVALFKIWQSVFEGDERIVKVIASQAANAYLSNQILKVGEIATLADVLAIAPYVSLNVPLEANDAGISAGNVAKWHLDQIFEYLNTVALPESKKWIEDSKKAADARNIKLVAYEAGQHLVGTQGAENNNQLTNLLLKANADERMGEIYVKNLSDWQAAGGDLICMYHSVGGWSKWGSWGLLQHTKDSAANSPKYKAVMDWAKSRGQKVSY